MARLEELTRGASVKGILPGTSVTVVDTTWHGGSVVELTYKDGSGRLGNERLYRDNEPSLEVTAAGRAWSFDGDGALLRLVAEAERIRLAHLFDPLLAVHTSDVEPLPHQITAVYGEMLPRQPLRFLLADDPGAGKTIMAGLLIRELLVRGDVERCLICCPGSLVDQWHDEMLRRFSLSFEIMTGASVQESHSGNSFAEKNLVIARLDHLSRNEDIQAMLEQTSWDLIVCDEAHKMSTSFNGGEVRETKRYKLGKLLGTLTRHLLLMTATPHNGKEEDFQLFMALLDGDRFEGRFRDGVHQVDTSDLMRRLIKEDLMKFDGTRLFPERIASTVNYRLSPLEARLYAAVTEYVEYVRHEMNRAERLMKEGEGRRGTVVGFALTTLQRRLASSPEAIYRSLQRRRERLERRVRDERAQKRGKEVALDARPPLFTRVDEAMLDYDDEAPSAEREEVEQEVVDQATAARTIAELDTEIRSLGELEALAFELRESGTDKKWEELSQLLQGNPAMFDVQGQRRKLIIFTEHRDTLSYLQGRITTLLGRREAIVVIHGSMGREERVKAQELFRQDKDTVVLLATDAAGEGVNLQRAHLMVNYDLPWNPNRLEQRFGRIHRIGQTEVCHLWNLVADEMREGDVFQRLFQKLEKERQALGGRVFDVLGKLFDATPLRDLLIEAIRYGDLPEVRAKLFEIVDAALDHRHLTALVEERALVRNVMYMTRVLEIREAMERAAARRLQPHCIASFFKAAFEHLGGTLYEREPRRYEVTRVPAPLRNRDRQIGSGAAVLTRYERITFERALISVPGKPVATLICPGQPLLEATLDLIIERHRDQFQHGAVLVDPADNGTAPRLLVALEHAIQDGRVDHAGNRRVVSKRMQFVEAAMTGGGLHFQNAGTAPYLDYRPPTADEQARIFPGDGVEAPRLAGTTRAPGEAAVADLVRTDVEALARGYAAGHVSREHLAEVRQRTTESVERTAAAVKDRLTKEINYWDHRAETLREQEQAGKVNARLNADNARRTADRLADRLRKRLQDLDEEQKISPLPPRVIGGVLVIPLGMLTGGSQRTVPPITATDTSRVELLAMQAVMDEERRLGFDPRDVSAEHVGYDIESRTPGSGRLRFLEVKGRVAGAATVTVMRNEVLTALNKPDDFILAIVEIDGDAARPPTYVTQPFHAEPDFSMTSTTYNIAKLVDRRVTA